MVFWPIYSSILPLGYWAEKNKPGCAPIRGFTLYEQVEHDQPGTPARIHSFAHEGDRAAMIEDIKRLKTQVDMVMVSMHWGIHFREAEIAMYQKNRSDMPPWMQAQMSSLDIMPIS